MSTLRFVLWIVFSFALAGSAYELRIWEDVTGNQFEGRFVKELFGKLTVEAEDGTEKKFLLEDLSELDQKYLRTQVPPEMDVSSTYKEVDVQTRPAIMDRVILTRDAQLTVEITKKSQRPFTSRLKVEIMLIAEECVSGNPVLMDITSREFLLPSVSKNATVELKSGVVRMEKSQEDRFEGGYAGQEYDGYMVVISTLDGDIVYVESSLQSWFEEPEVIENLRELWVAGRPSWVSRIFSKESRGKKVPPPRPDEDRRVDLSDLKYKLWDD